MRRIARVGQELHHVHVHATEAEHVHRDAVRGTATRIGGNGTRLGN